MSKYNNIEEEIDAFLNHSMSQEEEQQFKIRISNSPELAEEIRLQKIVVASLQLLHREQTMERLRKNTTFHGGEPSLENPTIFQRFKYWIWGLLVLMACLGGYWVIFRDKPIPNPPALNVIATQDTMPKQEQNIEGKYQDTLPTLKIDVQNSVIKEKQIVERKHHDTSITKELDLQIKFPESGQYKVELKNPPNDTNGRLTAPMAAVVIDVGKKIDPTFSYECLTPKSLFGATIMFDWFKDTRELIKAGTVTSLNKALYTLNNMNMDKLQGDQPAEFYFLRGYTYFNLQQMDKAYDDFDRPEITESPTRGGRARLYKWLCLRANYDSNKSKADELEQMISNLYKTEIAKYRNDLNGEK